MAYDAGITQRCSFEDAALCYCILKQKSKTSFETPFKIKPYLKIIRLLN